MVVGILLHTSRFSSHYLTVSLLPASFPFAVMDIPFVFGVIRTAFDLSAFSFGGQTYRSTAVFGIFDRA